MKSLFDEVSQQCSKSVTQSYSTSFSLATRMLSPSIRNHIYNIYGFVRLADEIVDTFHDFDKKILLSKSAKSDYLLFFINQIIMSVISPVLITQLAIATALFYYFHSVSWLDAGVWNNTPLVIIISAFTLFHFLLEDFSKYFVHRLMHKWPILWAIHKVHHSATFLTPMTVFRTHPLEGVVFSLRSAFTQAISISSFVFLFGPQVDIATILGANIFIFAFNIAGSNLRHSHIDIGYWKWLEYLIISPVSYTHLTLPTKA